MSQPSASPASKLARNHASTRPGQKYKSGMESNTLASLYFGEHVARHGPGLCLPGAARYAFRSAASSVALNMTRATVPGYVYSLPLSYPLVLPPMRPDLFPGA